MTYPNNGGYLLLNWVIQCNDKNGSGNLQNFINSTKTSSPLGDSGATSLPRTVDNFMYVETNASN